LLGFSVIRTVKTFFFGDPRSSKTRTNASSQRTQRPRQPSSSNRQKTRKKLISEGEGEYVDYEIVNNEKK
jgi:hypothetical protein